MLVQLASSEAVVLVCAFAGPGRGAGRGVPLGFGVAGFAAAGVAAAGAAGVVAAAGRGAEAAG
ncbi:hypothetical protein, partial [Cellulomonas sp. ICMP 17802]|uniref:hypothetical protein n=1 Tax=Cellulomonas sp. ICMP 17802 TaxID=3239199 RepID=UPI00351BE0D8